MLFIIMELKATVPDTAGFGFYLWQPYYGNINNVRELGPDRGYSWRGRSVGLLSVRNGEFNCWYYIVSNETKKCTNKDTDIILTSPIAFLNSVIYMPRYDSHQVGRHAMDVEISSSRT